MNWLVTITDSHTADGHTEHSEMETAAEVTGTADDYSVTYDEQSEELNGCKTTVNVTGGSRVQIIRSGAYTTEMTMEKGKRRQCIYVTPVGQLNMGIYATRIISEFNEDKSVTVDVTYTLDFNNELVSRNRVKITAINKEAE